MSLLCAAVQAQTFSFQTPATYAAQGDPLATAVADFNGDGHLDLAVANAGASTISVFTGKGDGTFNAPVIVSIPGGCLADNVTAGDFNNDGTIDLLTVCALQTTVWVVPGSGNGQFGTPVSSPLPLAALQLLGELFNAHTIAVADFNRDGKLDLVAITITGVKSGGASGGQLSLLLGNGDGTFKKASTLPFVPGFNVSTADFDGDGNPDLAVDQISGGSETIAILKGDGTGAFSTAASYTTTGVTALGCFRVADVNRDGVPDLIVESGVGNGTTPTSYLTILTGNGDFTFTALPSQPATDQVMWVLPVDLHGSGTVDLVEERMNYFANTSGIALSNTSLWIRQGNGDGTFQSPQMVTLPSGLVPWWFDAAAGDFNGDGAFDLAFTASPSNAVLNANAPGTNGLQAIVAGYQALPAGDLIVMVNTLAAPPPVLGVSQRKVQLTASQGGASASQALAISNLGAGTLKWTATASVTSSATWLTVSPGSGTGAGAITITAAPGSMAPSTYTGTVTVSATPGGSRSISVSFTVTAATNLPTITSVLNGASFLPGFEAGSWVTIKGSNLSSTNPGRTWLATEIVNGKLPTSLDNTSVTIDGKAAYVYYISPGQINVQAPDDSATGPVQVVVKNNAQVSNSFTAQVQSASPGFFLYSGASFAIATRYPDNALIGDPSAVPGTIAAKPGDVLILWATGFGPTNPATAAGAVVVVAAGVTTLPTVTVGGMPVTVIGAALSPGSVGLYQVAIQLPANVPTGDVAIQASVNAVQSPAGVLIYVSSP